MSQDTRLKYGLDFIYMHGLPKTNRIYEYNQIYATIKRKREKENNNYLKYYYF